MLSRSYKIVAPKRFDLYIEDINPSLTEAVVKVEYGAICKADLRYYNGNRNHRTLDLKYPMNLIHEAVGTVISDKTNTFNIGERVVLVPNILINKENKCYNCVCEKPSLGENYCPKAKFASSNTNGFSREFVNYPVDYMIEIPPAIDTRVAVFLELISVTIAAYRRANLNGDETIGVWGDGVLGYLMVNTLKTIHRSGTIIVIGKHDEKLRKFPADKYYLTGDKMISKENIQIAFECVGGESSSYAINEAIEYITVGGGIIFTGVSEKEIPINTRKILEKGLSIYGSTRSNCDDFRSAIKVLLNEEARNKIEKLILDEIRVNNIIDYYHSFEMEKSNKELGKYILDFDF